MLAGKPCDRVSLALSRISHQSSSSSITLNKGAKEWYNSKDQEESFPQKSRTVLFGSDVGPDVDHIQLQAPRYHVKQSNRNDSMPSRHRKASSKLHFDFEGDGTNTSDVEMEFIQKMHRLHRTKTGMGLQTGPVSHPKRGIGRVGVQVSINDCVCIASSADLGTGRDSNPDVGDKRHIFTWASRTSEPSPHELLHESESGTQIDISASQQPHEYSQPQECNCVCQSPAPQSAADYYHTMQSRQNNIHSQADNLEEQSNKSKNPTYISDARGGRSVLTTSLQPPLSFGGPKGGITDRDKRASAGQGVVLPGRYRHRRRSSIRDWPDPHKLHPDPLRWNGDRPFKWEDNLRNTETNALIAVHPQRWMPVGKQQYSHQHGYPSWPDAITSMFMPWSNPAVCYNISQPQQSMLCWPDSQCGQTAACYPTPSQYGQIAACYTTPNQCGQTAACYPTPNQCGQTAASYPTPLPNCDGGPSGTSCPSPPIHCGKMRQSCPC